MVNRNIKLKLSTMEVRNQYGMSRLSLKYKIQHKLSECKSLMRIAFLMSSTVAQTYLFRTFANLTVSMLGSNLNTKEKL